VTAGYQTAGRGQIGRSWYSSPNQNILASLVLRPSFLAVTDQFQLSIAISLAIYTTVLNYLPEREVSIKWPNDIYVDNKKIAGILIQNTLKGSTISHSIIGIGLNVNEVDWPAELPNPTSIAQELGQTRPTGELLAALLAEVERYYLNLQQGHSSYQREAYTQHLYRGGVDARYMEQNGTVLTGQIRGIDDNGRLVVDAGGTAKHYQFREIKYLP